jgi:hypothetical protein
MPRKLLLLGLFVILSLSSAFDVAAKPRQWQDATVIGAGGLSGGGVGVVHGLYLIKTEKITYVIPNYSKGPVLEHWLVFPADGHTKIAVNGSKIHILDTEGRDRAVRVVWTIVTKP